MDLAAEMQKVADEVAALGRKAYIIPGGGSNPLGALGYVSCAEEILAQTHELGIRLDHIVCASGSTGTHAGLICGLVGNNSHIPLTGINVRRTREEQEPNVHKLAQETAALLGIPGGIPRDAITALGDWVGPGYSLPTPEMVEAVQMLARVEGILLDPVYTGQDDGGTDRADSAGRVQEGRARAVRPHGRVAGPLRVPVGAGVGRRLAARCAGSSCDVRGRGGPLHSRRGQADRRRRAVQEAYDEIGDVRGLAVGVCLAAGAAWAQEQAGGPAGQQKDKAAAADPISGEWDGTVEMPDGAMPFSMKLKLEKDKVTGEIGSQQGAVADHRGVVRRRQADDHVHLRGRRTWSR